jgi:hypothetical protein
MANVPRVIFIKLFSLSDGTEIQARVFLIDKFIPRLEFDGPKLPGDKHSSLFLHVIKKNFYDNVSNLINFFFYVTEGMEK